jgi:hypothetical protein
MRDGPGERGDATRQVRDEYIHKMEDEWTVLRYCENHWKANTITTSIYSQWYHSYHKKMKGGNVKEEDGTQDGPVTKRCRATTEAPDDLHTPPPDPQAAREAAPMSEPMEVEIENILVAVAPSPQLGQQGPATSMVTSKPKARPLSNSL